METLIIIVVVIGIFLIIAQTRKGSSTLTEKPSNLKSFVANASSEVVLKTIVRFAQQTGYIVDTIEENNGRIALSDSATATSWGFFYPIFLSQQEDGKTLVEIGIKSKAIQVGPIVTQHHDKCFNGIKAAVFANT
jgi:hypothetical protein